MTFQDAVRKSIKAFQQGKTPQSLLKIRQENGGDLTYTPAYFDKLEKEVGKSKKPKRPKKATPVVDEMVTEPAEGHDESA